MRRLALALLVLLLALPLAGLAAARFYLTPDFLRARAGEAVLRATGRALTIAGPIRLTWALSPKLEARDVAFANPPGMSRPEMARAERVTMRLALLPLLSRRVEVRRVAVTGPDILLERDAAGRPNWLLTPPPPASVAPTAAPSAPQPRMQVAVDRVEIAGGRLGWAQGGQLLSAELMAASFDPATRAVAVAALFRATPVQLRGTVGPFATAPVPFDLNLTGAGVSATVSGSAAQAKIVLQAADLSTASVLAGIPLPPARNLHADWLIEPEPNGVTLRGIDATMQEGDLSGELRLAYQPRPTIHGSMTGHRLDLDGWAQPAHSAPPLPVPAPGQSSPPVPPPVTRPDRIIPDRIIPDRIIPEWRLPLAMLRQFDLDVQTVLDEVKWRGSAYRNVRAHPMLEHGKLRLAALHAEAPAGGAADGELAVDAAASPPTVSVSSRASGLQAGALLAALGAPAGGGGAADLDLQLTGQGETTRELAATLGGHAGLAIVNAAVDNRWLMAALGDALRRANLPLEPAGRSQVRCVAIRVDFAAGQGRLQALTLDTNRLDLEGSGGVDLAAETVDLHLRPQLRLGTSLSVPVHVTGTLRTPSVALDPGALSPGRVGIVIGGPPPPDRCGPALAAARDGRPGPEPAAPAPERRAKPADLLRGLLR